MFKNCRNLNYVNLLKLDIFGNLTISNITYGTNDNIIYCINDESKAIIIAEEFKKLENAKNNCTLLCKLEDTTYISVIGLCSIDCQNEEINKYILDNKCVDDCPNNSPYEYILFN